MIKPFYLNAIRANLPHVCGEALIDDLVCLAYMNVNGGSFDTATNIFQLINSYRGDVPSAMIGAGSIAAMQRNFDVAIKEFSDAIAIDGTIADAWKRRGQTRAARGLVKSAIKDLTKAISLLPGEADMYHQRGLVYHQTRNYTRALADFRVAHEKGMESAPLWNYIGMCEGQLGRVAPSLTAHERALRLQATFKEAQLNVALMHKEAGNWSQALVAFNKAIKCDTSAPFFQAYGHRGLMYIQLGRPALALKDLTTAVNALFTIVVGSAGATLNAEEKATRKTELIQHLLRAGLCYQTVGQYHKAVGYFDQAATLLPSTNGLFLREIALFLWSSLDVDLVLYNADDRVDPRLKDGWCKHADWVDYMAPHLAAAKTGAAAQKANLAGSSSVTSGALLGTGPYTPAAKPTQVPCLSRYSSGVAPDDDGELLPAPAEATGKPSSTPSEGMRNEEQKLRLVTLTTPFAKLIQMDSPGFMPNRRQHRMFGLAVLQMATSLSQHFALIGQEGIGLQVPDAASSRKFSTARTAGQAGTVSEGKKKQGISSSGSRSAASSSGSGGVGSTDISDGADSTEGSSARSHSPSGKRGIAAATHTFNWRDLYDIAVRWRQVSEPGDPVWWIDRFPTKAFEDGFGLQTPLVNGHLTTVRYAPYYQPAFDRVKDILLHQGYYTVSDMHMTLDTEAAARVAAAATLHELRAAVGSNFYVVVPCPSLRTPALVLEGTRLTLLTQEPEGFDFTIRTPGKHALLCLQKFVQRRSSLASTARICYFLLKS
jgi:tetratricopeptide (TPR) repeat protein